MDQATPNGTYESQTGNARLTIAESNSDTGEHFGGLELNGKNYNIRGNYFYTKLTDRSAVTLTVRAISEDGSVYINLELFSPDRKYLTLRGEFKSIGADTTSRLITLNKK